MTTVYITIGNSDDKLSQEQWAEFCAAVHLAVTGMLAHGAVVHFHGYSIPSAPWQNAMWAVELPDDPDVVDALRVRLAGLAWAYNQDSIAWGRVENVEFLAGQRNAAWDGSTW